MTPYGGRHVRSLRPAPRISTASDSSLVVVDLYARLSRNPSGELEKIETQLADTRRVAERNGWTVGAEHVDNSLSARRRGVQRPGWEALLTRIEAGQTGGVIVYHQDRLMRQPRDLERLLDAADRGLRLGSAHGSRDLADPDDRFIVRVEVAHACRSSDDSSRRIRRRLETLRQDCRVHGGPRVFGFPGVDRISRLPVSDGQVAREREAIRRASEQVVTGVALSRVAVAWNANGMLTSTGETWTSVRVRGVLLRARNAGLVEHGGVIVGLVHGEDEEIVGRELFDRVRATFASRRRGRVAGESYIGSGLIVCGVCGHGLSGRPHTGNYPDGAQRRQYHCPAPSRGGCGKVAADQRGVDAELRAFTLARLSDPRHVGAMARERGQAVERLGEIDRAVREATAVADALGERLCRGEIGLSTFDAAHGPLSRRLTALGVEREALVGATPQAVTVAAADALAAEWDDAEVAERRTMLRAALAGHRMVLDPAVSRGGRGGFDRGRLRLAERDE